jgi:hypothetical protein
MLTIEEIKQILYSSIYEIGKEKIQTDVTSDINLSQKYIDIIMEKSTKRIVSNSKQDYYDLTIPTLCEALLHFMLTICTLPSERKIQVKKNLALDIIIPGLENLKTKPCKSVIIQIIKENVRLNQISHLEFLQPNHKNIWLISSKPLLTTKYTIYSVFPNSALKYSNIMVDIDHFLTETGNKSFRFTH